MAARTPRAPWSTIAALFSLAIAGCKQDAPPAPPPPLPAPEPQDPEVLSRWDGVIQSLRVDAIERSGKIRQPKIPALQLRSAKRPTILAFWATYCPPCIEEMPMFEALHQEGHRVIGLSMDSDNLEEVARVLVKQRPSYPQVVLREVSMKRVGLELENGLPLTAILDRTGRTKALLPGKSDRTRILAALTLAK